MTTVRIATRVTLMALALLVALILHGLWRLARARSPWPRRLLGTIARIAGARPVITGTSLRHDAVFLANHQSWLDILILAGATGTAFVAKGELARVPLIGWLCGLNGTVFVDRTDRTGIAGQIASIRDALTAGSSIAIFPEGTTGDGRTLLPFKASLLAVLDPPPPGVRVQPVAISYGDAIGDIVWVGDEHGLENVKRVLGRRGGFRVDVRFLGAFEPTAVGNRKAIALLAYEQIAAIRKTE